MIPARVALAALLVGASGFFGGCATLPDGSRWAEKARFTTGWDRVREAAADAARDPRVWLPLAGAAVVQIDDWDHEISRWAIERTPVFGSVRHAEDASDILRMAAGAGYLASVLATPGGDYGADWWNAKLRGGMVGSAAMLATGLTTRILKDGANRTRPNGHHDSFPSGHTSFAAVADSLTARNLESIALSTRSRRAWTFGADALTLATGWARIEAGAHYPSDVMVGMAIGNFFGAVFNDAFIDDAAGQRLSLAVEPVPGGAQFAFSLRF